MTVILNPYIVHPAVAVTPINPSSLSGWAACWDAASTGNLSETGGVLASINDISGNGRNLTAFGSPAWDNTNGGRITLTAASSQYLKRDAAFLYAAGACTVIVSGLESNGNAGSSVINEGRSTNSNPQYSLMRNHFSNTTNDDMYAYSRDDTATISSIPNTSPLGVTLYNNTRKIAVITDSGTLVKGYVNGVEGTTPISYTRSGTLTLDRFAIGAMVRNTVAAYLDLKFNRIDIFTRVLTNEERNGVVEWLKADKSVTW